MQRVLPKSLIRFFHNLNRFDGSHYELQSRCLPILAILYSAKQSNEKSKGKYASATGKLFLKIRQSYLTMALLAMQDNSHHTFPEYGTLGNISFHASDPLYSGPYVSNSGGTDEDTSTGLGSTVTHPFWRKPEFVREKSLSESSIEVKKKICNWTNRG